MPNENELCCDEFENDIDNQPMDCDCKRPNWIAIGSFDVATYNRFEKFCDDMKMSSDKTINYLLDLVGDM